MSEIAAPAERCFDLARSIDFHTASMATSGERPVAGVTSGLIGPGEQVTWEARHLGVRQRLTSKIEAYDRPRWFVDAQVRGAFAWFRHEHHFEAQANGTTRLRDVFEFAAPLGPLGRLVCALFLTAYMRRLLTGHAERLKAAAESDAWRRFLPDSALPPGTAPRVVR